MANPFSPQGVTRSSLGTSSRGSVGIGVLDPPAKSLVLLTAGSVTVKSVSGSAIPFGPLNAGYVIPFVVSEIVALSGGATVATIDG